MLHLWIKAFVRGPQLLLLLVNTVYCCRKSDTIRHYKHISVKDNKKGLINETHANIVKLWYAYTDDSIVLGIGNIEERGISSLGYPSLI